METKPRISIIGMGFVGLVSASCFADKGFQVIGTTLDEKAIELINKGKSPFYEEGLAPILKRAVDKGNLKASLYNEEAVKNSDISFISVGTPMRKDKSIDLTYIKNCSKEIGRALNNKDEYHLIVDRSTVVPGTTRNIIGYNIEKESGKKMGKDFGLCMQPEFLREGNSVYDTLHPNRIVIGEYDKKSGDLLEEAWKIFYGGSEVPILRMNIESAEMVKYANNCFLATKISFANEISKICETVPNMDITQVMEGIGLDDRISHKFLNAGAGFGGSCFPKDVNAIISFAQENNINPKLLNMVLEVNEDQAKHLVDVAENLINDFKGKKLTILGLSFKPGTDDMREASSIRVIDELIKRGADNIVGYDPHTDGVAKSVLGDKIQYADSINEALKDSECAFLITEWEQFKELSPHDFKNQMDTPNLIDGRRIYSYESFHSELPFRAIGRRDPH
jgi:UDPglucose 6-dehydrogenase